MSDPRKGPEAESQTHFGYQSVPESQKAYKVAEVFHSVAAKYDVMTDLMSAGIHRLWKRFFVATTQVRNSPSNSPACAAATECWTSPAVPAT